VPEYLPVARSERVGAEILDEILARAVGVHFLPNTSTGGPRPLAGVKGHEDLVELEPQMPITRAPGASSEVHRTQETSGRLTDMSKTSRRSRRDGSRHLEHVSPRVLPKISNSLESSLRKRPNRRDRNHRRLVNLLARHKLSLRLEHGPRPSQDKQ